MRIAVAIFALSLPALGQTVIFTGSEGASSGSPVRDAYTNCGLTCPSTTLQPSPAGQLWCTAAAKAAAGGNCAGNGVVTSSIFGTGTTSLSNGLGAGGVDSLASVSVSYENPSAGDCGSATNYPSQLVPNITLPGAVANARSIFSGTTQSSNVNTSLLAPTKWAIPGGDVAANYIVQACETVPVTSGSGFHLELDLNHTLSTDDYVGPGSHYNFGLGEWDYCPQGCSGWKKMNLMSGGLNVTPAFPANHHIYMEWYYHRTASCSSSSGANCYFYDAACFKDYTAGSAMVCGNWQDATTGQTPGGIPVHKAGFTTNQINVQHQLDFNSASFTGSVNSDFRNVVAYSANWSAFIDPSRATDWTTAGFAIPNYTTNCVIQPTLLSGSGNAGANTTSIQASINSCDLTHNVVNIPAGTYYFTSIDYGHKSKVVVRGAGASSTTILTTADTANNFIPSSISIGCNDDNTVFCRIWSNTELQPPSGAYQCAWTAGYAKGATSITLNTCGSTPPVNSMIVLDQANDSSDNGGVSVCDAFSSGSGYPCAQETPNNNPNGRNIGGVIHSQTQVVWVTGVSGSGAGPYIVTISQPVAFNNIRTSQNPGAFWSPNFAINDGIENMAVNFSAAPDGIALTNCYQCWVRGMKFSIGGRSDVATHQTLQTVIRDSYFFSSQNPSASQSYGVETSVASSGSLIENNIFQQLTIPIQFGSGTGNVVGYNFVIDNQFGATNMAPASSLHSGGADMNLWEGNVANQIIADDSWGASNNGTLFRNNLTGWQLGKNQFTYAVGIYAANRAFNVVGNVLGQPGYDTLYESYATSTSGGVNGGDPANTSVYNLGWTGYSGWGGCATSGTGTQCDPQSRSTLMRWGNYDTVTAGTKWDSTEASPAAVPYVSANFTPTYFSSLAHTLPNSLYYSSTPSWWTSGKAWPPIGPDVSGGNVGTCSGTYAGSQGTLTGQCSGGTLSSAWGNHVASIPAQDCYLKTLNGPPDGSGSVLPFDANNCYVTTPPSNVPPPPTSIIVLQ